MAVNRRSPRASYVPIGYVQYAAGSIDTAKNVDAPPGASAVLLRCNTQSVRWRDDGVDPTTTKGMLMLAADAPYFYQGDLTKLKVISATAGAILDCLFYA